MTDLGKDCMIDIVLWLHRYGARLDLSSCGLRNSSQVKLLRKIYESFCLRGSLRVEDC